MKKRYKTTGYKIFAVFGYVNWLILLFIIILAHSPKFGGFGATFFLLPLLPFMILFSLISPLCGEVERRKIVKENIDIPSSENFYYLFFKLGIFLNIGFWLFPYIFYLLDKMKFYYS